jgi:hypothetical protein
MRIAMRVTFKKTGGFAGLPGQHQRLELDTTSGGGELSADKARELEQLVAAADAPEQSSEQPGASQVRDGCQYDLTIEDDEGGQRQITARDGAVSAEVEPLIRWLNRELNETLKQKKRAREQSS